MASTKNQTATWNRDDRDLLVELRTNMQNMRNDLADARNEIKDINSGITSRLLNLEGNAVSKIEIDGYDKRIRALENLQNQWLGRQALIGVLGGGVLAILCAIISTGYIHF